MNIFKWLKSFFAGDELTFTDDCSCFECTLCDEECDIINEPDMKPQKKEKKKAKKSSKKC